MTTPAAVLLAHLSQGTTLRELGLHREEAKRLLQPALEEWMKTKIPIKRFVDEPGLPWEERFKRLEAHHMEETAFLINRINLLETEADAVEVEYKHLLEVTTVPCRRCDGGKNYGPNPPDPAICVCGGSGRENARDVLRDLREHTSLLESRLKATLEELGDLRDRLEGQTPLGGSDVAPQDADRPTQAPEAQQPVGETAVQPMDPPAGQTGS